MFLVITQEADKITFDLDVKLIMEVEFTLDFTGSTHISLDEYN